MIRFWIDVDGSEYDRAVQCFERVVNLARGLRPYDIQIVHHASVGANRRVRRQSIVDFVLVQPSRDLGIDPEACANDSPRRAMGIGPMMERRAFVATSAASATVPALPAAVGRAQSR